jgi:TorA maturation chaperone TorD
MTAAPLNFVPTLPPEEVARANFYGLLARLFYAPPDAPLLEALAGADDMDAEGDMAAAWSALSREARGADPEKLLEEFETAFVGTGKAPVTLYTSAYSVRFTNETPLAELRGALAALGLGRKSDAAEPEDHVAALFDVMRFLIAEHKPLEEQKAFFERWIWPSVLPLCAAIKESSGSNFFIAVAHFTKAFAELEHSAFELL